jgi:hypothetical protein
VGSPCRREAPVCWRTGASAHSSTEQIINSEDAGRHSCPYRPRHVAADDLGSCSRHWRPDGSPSLSPSKPITGDLWAKSLSLRPCGWVVPRGIRTLMIRQYPLMAERGDEATGSRSGYEVPGATTRADESSCHGAPDAVEEVVTDKQILAGDVRPGDTLRTILRQTPFCEPRWHWLRERLSRCSSTRKGLRPSTSDSI